MGWGPFGAPGWGYDMVSPRLWPGFFEIWKKILGRGHKKEISKKIQSDWKEILIVAQLSGSLPSERTFGSILTSDLFSFLTFSHSFLFFSFLFFYPPVLDMGAVYSAFKLFFPFLF